MKKRREIFFGQLVCGVDVITLTISYMAAYWLRDHAFGSWYGELRPLEGYLWILWVALPIWVFFSRKLGLYGTAAYDSIPSILNRLWRLQALSILTVFSAMYLTRAIDVSRLLLQSFLVVSTLALLAEKIAIRIALVYYRNRPTEQSRNVLVIGAPSQAGRLFDYLQDQLYWGGQVVGLLSSNGRNDQECGGKPVLGHLADLAPVLHDHIVDEVVAVSAGGEGMQLVDVARACLERGVTFRTLVELPPMPVGRYHVEDLDRGRFLLSLETVPQEPVPLLIKRIVDILGALVGLFLCGPIFLWYSCKLKRESPGAILFRQERVGENGRIFTLYKFRTMRPDAEACLPELMARNEMNGYMFKMKNDPRVIPSGKTLRRRHLDEMPQFWNVLKGDMSLVGTRPPTPDEVASYMPHHYRRLSMKPGLTGLWQINGNGTVSDFEKVVKLDCEYIDQWSLWLDCKIMTRTVIKVLRGEGW